MSDSITYIHLRPGTDPCDIEKKPSKFVVAVEAEVTYEWQKLVSEWMVESGCLYMMAWGRECSSWDDSVDWANIEKFGDGPIPDDQFVLTTWHDHEPLTEVFWYAKSVAKHQNAALLRTVILHISSAARQSDLIRLLESA